MSAPLTPLVIDDDLTIYLEFVAGVRVKPPISMDVTAWRVSVILPMGGQIDVGYFPVPYAVPDRLDYQQAEKEARALKARIEHALLNPPR